MNVHCCDHSVEIENYTINVIEALEKASMDCLPINFGRCRKKRKGNVPGWTEHVKPHCEDSKFWYSVWRSLGKPCSGYVFERMKSSNHQYKSAKRRVQEM